MTKADQYRMQAARLAAQARDPHHAAIRHELLRMSQGYLRLAEQADRNSQTDITYENSPFGQMGLRSIS